MELKIQLDTKYIYNENIEMECGSNKLIAIIPSSYRDREVYKVNVVALAERKREIFDKWRENSMKHNLTDMIYNEFPYDIANFLIYGIMIY